MALLLNDPLGFETPNRILFAIDIMGSWALRVGILLAILLLLSKLGLRSPGTAKSYVPWVGLALIAAAAISVVVGVALEASLFAWAAGGFLLSLLPLLAATSRSSRTGWLLAAGALGVLAFALASMPRDGMASMFTDTLAFAVTAAQGLMGLIGLVQLATRDLASIPSG